MEQEGFKRKLTAILSADVEGYSRLMGEDEDETIRTLTTYRELMSTLIQKHRGRVVDSPGDNLLAEFGSVVDAVRCAVEVQEELRVRNAELPENRRMHFRIGVNMGDVVEEEGRIYGDGVNITARVEGLAEGGGICISGTVYDSIKNKLSLSYESLGEHTVKNIAEPVRVYRMRIGPEAAAPVVEKAEPRRWLKLSLAVVVVLVVAVGAWAIWNFYFRPPPIEPASIEKMAHPLPDSPSIAVLPFVNMIGDPKEDYIVDGITESIITGLSKTPKMFVIASNSVFRYKGKAVEIRQVGEELGVRYVLEGSVQKTGNRLRINVQLIDAIKGHHLWADKYDRDLKDFFALQDEITMKILTELQVKLTKGEFARALAKGTNNIEAYFKTLQAFHLFLRFSKEDNIQSRKLSEEVIDLDPKYPMGYLRLGWTHYLDAMYKWSTSRKESLALGEELAKKALELDDTLSTSHALLANIYRLESQWDKALAEIERAVSLDPTSNNIALFGLILNRIGRYNEAIAMLKRVIRKDPLPKAWVLNLLGNSYFWAKQYEEALATFKQVLECANKGEIRIQLPIVYLAGTYFMLGKEKEARDHVAELVRIDPKYTIKYFSKVTIIKNQADKDRMIDALRKAGLPEYSQIALPDKPSIAVLPFVNISGDPEQAYFSDGLTEDLITSLSKFRGLFVISGNSAFSYKGQAVKPEQIRKELGVRYMLEGSVRKAGKRVRITAQLIDTTTGGHQWADRYDRELKDIFTLQDEITQQIVSALGVKFEQIEQERAFRKDTANLNAFDYNLRGWWYYKRKTKKDNDQARLMFEKAIEIEPKFADAYAGLGLTYYEQWARQWSQNPQSLERAFELAKRAIALDDSRPAAYSLLSHVYLWKKQHAQAIAAIKRTIDLDPNDADGYADLAETLVWVGKPSESLELVEKAMRLNPHYPASYIFNLGFAYFARERYEEAEAALKRTLTRSPDHLGAHLVLATIYSEVGRKKEAHAHVEEALRVNPQLSIEDLRQRLPALPEREIDALRKAGLPE